MVTTYVRVGQVIGQAERVIGIPITPIVIRLLRFFFALNFWPDIRYFFRNFARLPYTTVFNGDSAVRRRKCSGTRCLHFTVANFHRRNELNGIS